MRGIRWAILSAMVAMAAPGQASTIGEIEPNNSVQAPQVVVVPGALTVSAALGNVTGGSVSDLDYYKFYGQEGDVVDIDIDDGWDPVSRFDTYIAIFDTSALFKKLRENDDAVIDPGSANAADARIEKFRLPATGYYIVGVSNYPRTFQHGGGVLNPAAFKNGDYTLIVSGVTPAVTYINIDIKPGNDEPAPVNPKSKGKVPVALLASATFDVAAIDRHSITFGSSGDEPSLHSCNEPQDVNGDGLLDLMCHFQNQVADFDKGDLEGIVRGKTQDGRSFEGRGLLKVVPGKH